jgi:ketosteroid isomerase-like protein
VGKIAIIGFASALVMAACRSPSAASGSPDASAPPNLERTLLEAAAPRDDEPRRVVLAWNAALDQHDLATLERLYGDPVMLYGRATSRSALVAAKRRALGGASEFHQALVGEIRLTSTGSSTVAAVFTKRSGNHGKLADVEGKLVLRREDGGAWVIIEETDALTEARRAKSEPSSCEAVARTIVEALPVVKQTISRLVRAAEKSGGRARFGGVGPLDEEGGGFTAGIGLHTDQRFEAEIWYAVDSAGVLRVTVAGEDAAIPADALRTVERACKQ